jgi:rRNA maturation endonuclease Nob1
VAGQQASKPAKVSSSPSIITDEEMANCVPCECDHDGDHTHHEVEHQDTAPVSVVIENVQRTDDNVQSTDDKDANKEDVSVPQVPPPAGVDEVAEEIMAQLEDLDIAEQEAQEDYSDDDHEDDQDSQDEARHVSFEPEPKELEQVPPSFTSEDFPSLGGPVTKSQDVPPPAPTTNSWAKKISSEVLQPATSAQAFAAPRSTTNQVITSSAAVSTSEHDHISHFESGPELSSTSTITSETNSGSDKKAIPSRILSGGVGGGYANSEWNARQSNEDDGIGWINPTNVDTCKNSGQNMLNSQAFEKVNADFKVVSSGKKKRGKKQQASEEPQVVRPFNVACMTTDYAMQNVMVQMGLQVLSTDCRLIKQVKQWVLRCGACFQVHYDMDRLFCSRCGSNLMQRISASTDSRTGELRLHLKKNYHYNTRGLIHSLPKAGKQKKYDGELLLREDQLMSGIWRQKVVKIRKDVRSAFGEDVTADVGMHINKGAAIKVGLGRRNPNADRGRERRGKKKK